MMASFSGHWDVVRVLIEANANVQKRTKKVYMCTGQPLHRHAMIM